VRKKRFLSKSDTGPGCIGLDIGANSCLEGPKGKLNDVWGRVSILHQSEYTVAVSKWDTRKNAMYSICIILI
jgi:hypothetical protein